MTQFTFTDDYDEFGQPREQTQIACPRGWRKLDDQPDERLSGNTNADDLCQAGDDADVHIRDRVAKTTTYELEDTTGKRVFELVSLFRHKSPI